MPPFHDGRERLSERCTVDVGVVVQVDVAGKDHSSHNGEDVYDHDLLRLSRNDGFRVSLSKVIA
jgi:hypothetical protein